MTAPDPSPLPEGEMALVSTELLLADQFRADAVAGFQFGEAGEQLCVHMVFAGRRNHTTTREQIEVAISPLAVFEIVDQMLRAASLITRRAEQTGAGR